LQIARWQGGLPRPIPWMASDRVVTFLARNASVRNFAILLYKEEVWTL
jgi:hypothetical protein